MECHQHWPGPLSVVMRTILMRTMGLSLTTVKSTPSRYEIRPAHDEFSEVIGQAPEFLQRAQAGQTCIWTGTQ
ncbi:hypothetical protein WJX79_006974 [Trebouxia sp. C0005]